MGVYYIAGMAYDSNYLEHHGIKGQRWGIRRFQNEDGSLTDAGMKRYNSARNIQRDLNKLDKEIAYNKGDAMKLASKASRLERKVNRYNKKHPNDDKGRMEKYTSKMKDYNDQLTNLSNKSNEYKKRQEGLQWAALGRGMNVTLKTIPRESVRPGEHFAKASLAMAGAMSMAYFSPIGFGAAFYNTTPHVSGTKYKVRKNET